MISFSCSQCGMKIKVKPEFAGRSSKCPTCKKPLVVPVPDKTQAEVRAGQIDGTDSSLAKAGIDAGVTLAGAARPGLKSVVDILARRARNDGRYIIEGEIARGGMGTILRAVDCDIRREVAVKYLLNQSDAAKKARFVEEAQITGQLEHPNIVPIHELGVDNLKRLFFSMKMVKGRSLAQVLDDLRKNPKQAEKDWALGRLLNILVNVCNALAYAHSRGVVHRDLKPANVMIGDFGEVYVMDWGLAKVLREGTPAGKAEPPLAPVPGPKVSSIQSSKVETSREPQADLTQEGAVLGTPVYMPPEQATGHVDAIDQRSDIYSLGAILYEMLTLQAPIGKEDGYLAILMRVMQGEIVSPEQRSPERARAGKIPRELSAIAMKALAKQPQDRYQNTEAFRKDIERFQEGRSVSAKEDTKREMLWKFVKRNRGFSAGVAVALIVLLASLGVISKAWWDAAQAQRDRQEQIRKSTGAFLRAARLAINDRQLGDALAQADVVLDADKDHDEARLLKGQVLIAQKDYAKARAELERYVRLKPNDPAGQELLHLCQTAKGDETALLLAFADVFRRQKADALVQQMYQYVQGDVAAKRRILPDYQQRIQKAWPDVQGPSLDETSGSISLSLASRQDMTDLTPLKGMLLNSLNLYNCGQLRDLTPLKGMPLTTLNLARCVQVRDLTPLQGMPLTTLRLEGCVQVRDLAPLQGMPLAFLSLWGCPHVSDLTPLEGMKLTELWLTPKSITRGMDVLRQMKSLTKIGLGFGQPLLSQEEFWKKYDAGEFTK